MTTTFPVISNTAIQNEYGTHEHFEIIVAGFNLKNSYQQFVRSVLLFCYQFHEQS